MEKPVPELGSGDTSGTPTDKDFTNPTWSKCTYCIQEEGLCDCVNMSDGSISDPYLQSILLESAVQPESLINRNVEDSTTVNAVEKKASAFSTDYEPLNESFPEEYRQLLASMFHAATSLGQVYLQSMRHLTGSSKMWQTSVTRSSVYFFKSLLFVLLVEVFNSCGSFLSNSLPRA